MSCICFVDRIMQVIRHLSLEACVISATVMDKISNKNTREERCLLEIISKWKSNFRETNIRSAAPLGRCGKRDGVRTSSIDFLNHPSMCYVREATRLPSGVGVICWRPDFQDIFIQKYMRFTIFAWWNYGDSLIHFNDFLTRVYGISKKWVSKRLCQCIRVSKLILNFA